jgi:hypothetical protein
MLNDLVGDGERVNVGPRHGDHRRIQALDSRLEGAFVAVTQALDEIRLRRGDVTADGGSGHEREASGQLGGGRESVKAVANRP